MVQLGVVAAVTISVLLMKPLLIALYLRRRAPHHCGDLDPFRTIRRMYVVLLKPPGSSEVTWFPEILESEQTWRIFQSSTSSRFAHT